MKKLFVTFTIIFLSGITSLFAQSDCSNALPVCTNANSGGVVNGLGRDDFGGRVESGCLKNGLGVNTIETNSFWLKVKLAESGEFGFNIIPNDLSEDWDFAVYGPGAVCGALNSPIACNYSKNSPTGRTGVGIDPGTGDQTIAYDSWMNVQAGEEYLILVNQYAGNNTGFSITWQGAVIDNNAQPLDCSILVDLGPDRELCTGESTTLNATTFGANISYEWFLKNENTGFYEPLVPAVSTSTLTVNTTGDYKVEVTDGNTNQVLDDDIVVTFHTTPTATPVSDMIQCDIDVNNIENFDLESQTNLIKNGQNGVTVTYHESEIFAQSDVGAITSRYPSGGATIWARIENDVSGCYELTSFDLLVVQSSEATKPPDLTLCDDDNDGRMVFDLTAQTPIILNGQLGIITYYSDEQNAIDRKGWIINPENYLSDSKTIWARVEPSPNSPCSAITEFELIVLETPIAVGPADIQQCDNNNDGFYEFDLHALKDTEIIDFQDPNEFVVTYYPSQLDADNNTNMLANPYTNVTAYAIETIYARIENIESSACYDTTSFQLQVLDAAYPPLPSEIPNLAYCDDDSDGDDTNGFFEFDLTEQESILLNGQSSLVFNITYYVDPGYTNQIMNPTNYTNVIGNQQTIYARVSNSHPNNVNCYSDTSFEIEVKPLPLARLTPFTLRQCDEDGNPDGFTDFMLAEADSFLNLGNPLLPITYHINVLDAEAGINQIPKNNFSNSTSNVIYGRVNDPNGCYRIVQVNLEVSTTSFPSTYYQSVEMCDDDGVNDGYYTFTLAQYTSEILTQFPPQNLSVSYYRNQNDALTELNSISPTSPFINETPYSQILWVRVENTVDGGCAGIGPVLELIVNPIPEFELNSTEILCLNNIPLTVETFNSDGIYTYEWTDEAGTVVSLSPTAEITQAGTYTVVARSNLGCDSFPRQVLVEESNIASISLDDIQVTENSEDNTITISTQSLGLGDYEFSLNDFDGPYQDEPVFSRVAPGVHTLFIRDKNGCGVVQITIYVFGFPKFFTPNNDGYNDRWNIRGVDPSLLTNSIVYIYDRYGKMLATFSAASPGWDGLYNNELANSSDYWFLAKIVDVNGNASEYKGHFSLIRR